MDELTSQFPFEIGIDFKYIETLDHGAFGTVIHVIEISTKKDMAIKVINKLNSRPSVINEEKKEEINENNDKNIDENNFKESKMDDINIKTYDQNKESANQEDEYKFDENIINFILSIFIPI